MKHESFEVVISRLAPGEVESLRLDLVRAAIVVSRCGDGHSVVIESRSNAVFSAEDVLDVLASWIEKRPERLTSASVTVQRASAGDGLLRRFRGIPDSARSRRHGAIAPIRTPRPAIERHTGT